MDISGVDVDYLSDEEILELCSDIVDCDNNEISVLKGVDINNFSDDEVQKVYDYVISAGNIPPENTKVIHLSDKQILDDNYNIVDTDGNDIFVLNGSNINLDNLSDNEILALYNETIDTESSFFMAATVYAAFGSCGGYGTFDNYCGSGYCYYGQIAIAYCKTATRWWYSNNCIMNSGYKVDHLKDVVTSPNSHCSLEAYEPYYTSSDGKYFVFTVYMKCTDYHYNPVTYTQSANTYCTFISAK